MSKTPSEGITSFELCFFFLRAVRNGKGVENFKSGGFRGLCLNKVHVYCIYIHELYLNTNFREARRLILSLCDKKVKKKLIYITNI